VLNTLVSSTIDVLVTKIVEGAADGAPGALDCTDVTTTICELVSTEVCSSVAVTVCGTVKGTSFVIVLGAWTIVTGLLTVTCSPRSRS